MGYRLFLTHQTEDIAPAEADAFGADTAVDLAAAHIVAGFGQFLRLARAEPGDAAAAMDRMHELVRAALDQGGEDRILAVLGEGRCRLFLGLSEERLSALHEGAELAGRAVWGCRPSLALACAERALDRSDRGAHGRLH